MFSFSPIRSSLAAGGFSALALLLTGTAAFAQATVDFQVPFNLAGLVSPRGVAVAPDGVVYVADVESNTSGRVFRITPTGVVGGASGGTASLPGTVATLAPTVGGAPVTLVNPNALAVDAAGHLYISDIAGHQVLELMAPETSAAAVKLTYPGTAPTALATDSVDNLYIADAAKHAIYKVLAGATTGTSIGITPATLDPVGLAVDAANNVLFADAKNNAIYKFTAVGSSTAVFLANPSAGSFQFSAAKAGLPTGMGFDPGGHLYVLDSAATFLWEISETAPTTNVRLPFSTATTVPGSLAVSNVGNLFVSDDSPTTGLDELFYNNNPVNLGSIPAGTPSPILNLNFQFYVADSGLAQYESVEGDTTNEIVLTGGACTGATCNVQVQATYQASTPGLRNGIIGAIDGAKNVLAVPIIGTSVAASLALYPGVQDTLSQGPQKLYEPQAGTVTGNGKTFFVVDEGGELNLRPPTYTHGAVYAYTVSAAGVPAGTPTRVGNFPTPIAIALDAAGNLYVADYSGFVTKIPPSYNANSGLTTWPTGGTRLTFPPGIALDHPTSLAIDTSGNLYIGDMGPLGTLASVSQPGFIVKVPGDGGPAVQLNYQVNGAPVIFPGGLTTDQFGNLFIADSGDGVTTNGSVDIVPAATGVPAPISFGTFAPLNVPSALAFDAANDLYVVDGFNYRVLTVPITYTGTTPSANTAGITLLGGRPGLSGLTSPLITPSAVVVWPGQNTLSVLDIGYQPTNGPGNPTQVLTLQSFSTSVDATRGSVSLAGINVGNKQITFLAPTKGGANPARFSLSGCGDAGSTLSPGLTNACTTTINYDGGGSTQQSAAFRLNGNAALDGSALGNIITVNATPYVPIGVLTGYGNQHGNFGTITVQNQGPAPLNITALSAIPNTFIVPLGNIAITGGTCTSITTLNQNQTCTINFQFTAFVFGYASANINVTDNTGGVAGTVQSVTVTNE